MTTTTTDTTSDSSAENGALLDVRGLEVEFRTRHGLVRANRGVTYRLDRGESLAIVGESGSGKSVSAQAVMGIIDSPPGFVTGGEVLFDGRDLLTMDPSERRRIRGNRIAMIFQDALTALNPVFSVGWQIGEMFRKHQGMSKKDAKQRSIELMDMVRIPSARERVNDYPHEFSGGMRQRVMIAMALALDPDVLIADEPTTALDVTVQAQTMGLLADLQQETGMGLILITHDLGVVADVADRLAVMYAGEIVETGSVWDIYGAPAHPYTKGLMYSIPRVDQKGQQLRTIEGSPPNLSDIPSGCPFHPRCAYRRDRCIKEEPPLYDVTEGRGSACHYYEEVLSDTAS